ncbi:Homer protein-like protein 2 [Frankliniella fusca]|uniref:Homer protein-like protein 2 n=1 Tax=Frankliniella fusca TaxID=407009 RepID=A0AAE1H014_9NEOP|nr:Homer protein-like protein 2 [Frankliniella fusca]
MTSGKETMGEQPIFTCKAHVFHIDPKTKRSWIPASSSAVSVSFFYDSTRNLYRIISVEGTKAVINSTITPNMTFTKTSQKFGQWSDVRANTVYGLGFATEVELNKFIEKFQEVKEATRLVGNNKPTTNGQSTGVTPVTSANASPVSTRAASGSVQVGQGDSQQLLEPPGAHLNNSGTATIKVEGEGGTSHVRSQSLSAGESPKHQVGDKSSAPLGSGEAQLKYENDRLKLALAQSSANAKKWEVELATLKSNNVRLTSALQESTANVEEWKRQLQSYKEENQRLKTRYLELEAAKGSTEAAVELRKELATLRLRIETMEGEISTKDEEIKRLNMLKQQQQQNAAPAEERIKSLQQDNAELQAAMSLAQAQLETALAAQDSQRRVIDTLNNQLAGRIQELTMIHQEMTTALQT